MAIEIIRWVEAVAVQPAAFVTVTEYTPVLALVTLLIKAFPVEFVTEKLFGPTHV